MLAHAKLEFYTNLVLRILHFHEKGSDLQFVAQQYWPAKVMLTEEKNSAPNVALPTSRSGKVVSTVE